MKTKLIPGLAALALLAATGMAATTPPKKTVKPATPAKAAQPVDPRAKIEAAVRGKVSAYFKANKTMGSAGTSVMGVTIQSMATEPMSGWTGRYRTSGTVELTMGGSGAKNGGQKQTRSFDAYTTVSESGAVEVTEVSG